jgi:hypothetical protein
MCRDLRGNGRGQCRRLRRTARQRTMDSLFGGIEWSRNETAAGPVEAAISRSARFDRMSFAEAVYSTSLCAVIRTTNSTCVSVSAMAEPRLFDQACVHTPRNAARRLQAVL